MQAIAAWAYANGMLPEDAPWSDRFSKMRVTAEQSDRSSFAVAELQALFDAPLFVGGVIPAGAKGDAGAWLPLLALFTGARQAELAGLSVGDVIVEDGTHVLLVTEQLKVGKRLKTKGSQRAIPLHPQLVGFGFVEYVAMRAKESSTALACCRFGGHRDKVFNGAGEWECREGSSAASSSLRR